MTDKPTYYLVKHVTSFHYSTPVREAVMELRMQPREEGPQRCLSFDLRTYPSARISAYTDHYDNQVHYFGLPGRHEDISIVVEASVELSTANPPSSSATWQAVDSAVQTGLFYDWLEPSRFARSSEASIAFARETGIDRNLTPGEALERMSSAIYDAFEYRPQSTRVDSPIDLALQQRAGVCQDFSHLMIALARSVGIPCRYVSGYLFHRQGEGDRSALDSTHAWVEAWLPDVGWVGFDPTNHLRCASRHIRVAVGRDYADVPPNRGVYKGKAEQELAVGVSVFTIPEPLPKAPSLVTYITSPDSDDPLSESQQ